MIPVILAGGVGTRLWPLSRKLYPKQFLPLCGERTMLQETLFRLEGIPGLRAPLIVCNEEHRFIVAEQLRQIGFERATVLLEPVGRNTAPAICVAALTVLGTLLRAEDDLLLMLPADHVINDVQAFRDAIEIARSSAADGGLVTFGIRPTAPETGYGYIKARLDGDQPAMILDRFVEKPDRATAEQFLTSGEYYWNSGMFVFKASAYLAELERFAPDIVQACRAAVSGGKRDADFIRLDKSSFSACPADSIDYAVMEKTDKARLVSLDAGWSDVGSWSALWDVIKKNEDGNVNKGDVLSLNQKNSYVHSSGGRLVVTLGVEDMVVVETADVVLVAHKSQVQDVKSIVEKLAKADRKEATYHRLVHRPWGTFDSIDAGARYQVKRITVTPGARLSVQMHHHRAEHWVVVTGTAKVRVGDRELLLSENQSTYIPIGVVHSLENPGKVPLEIIEVQSGAYLGEDDIVRLEDSYGRVDAADHQPQRSEL